MDAKTETIQFYINKLRQQLNSAYSDGNLSALTHNKIVWNVNELEQFLKKENIIITQNERKAQH